MINFVKNISPIEVAAILLIVIVLFGSKVATKLGKTSGETLREIKKIKKSFTEAIEDVDDEPVTTKKEKSR